MNKRNALVIGLWHWKRVWFGHFFPEYHLSYADLGTTPEGIEDMVVVKNVSVLIIWGYSEDPETLALASASDIAVFRVEDGFLRSRGLTGDEEPAISLCVDSQDLYFNPYKPSDLEELLSRHDFRRDTQLLRRAAQSIADLKTRGISKYNHAPASDPSTIFTGHAKPRILVVGQVEDDMSIKFGANRGYTNNRLVEQARDENPGAEIVYKPHPDVLAGHRKARSNPARVSHLAKIVTTPLHVTDVLPIVDVIYTATSLVGLEALLWGVEVRVVGKPFYAGWGLTIDDHQFPRRQRRLALEELFAGCYLLYPRYAHPESGDRIDALTAITLLAGSRQHAA